MMRSLKDKWNRLIYKQIIPFFIVNIGKGLMRLLLATCRWEVHGLDLFKSIADQEKCILMLWHNRLALAPFILFRYARHFSYGAFISNSRDGELISAIVHSYKTGQTIRVPHHSRHQALKEMIHYLEQKRGVIVITPDGPRGPRYQIKPGITLAALETSAYIVRLNWKASRMWEMNTWDRLRIPKPFSKIIVSFEKPIVLNKANVPNLEEAQAILHNTFAEKE